MTRILSGILIAVSLGFFLYVDWPDLASVSGGQAAPLAQKRVIFEEDIFWRKPEETDRLLKRIKEAGFNVFVVNVWHGRGTMWSSQFAPWDPLVANKQDPDYDPLGYLIHRAKSMDIEVHAWFTVTLRQSALFQQYAPEGTPDKAYDIHDPNFRKLMVDLVGEVVSRYDVKGVNLDYIRTMGFCQNSKCRSDYSQSYQRDLIADIQRFESLPTNVLKKNLVPTLVEFQEAAVQRAVEAFSQKVRGLDPHLILSVDALPGQIGPEQGQDSLRWLREGLIDVVFRMDYAPQPNLNLMQSLRRQVPVPDALTLLISNIDHKKHSGETKFFPREGLWLEETIAEIGKRWPEAGIGIYMSKFLSDEQIAHLRKGPGSFPDRMPPNPPGVLSVD